MPTVYLPVFKGNRSAHDARCSILDARSSMLVKDPVSRIEHRASSLCLSG
ncbi:MAG: hypothetical protein AB1797_02935 [bacterium]